MTTPQGSPENDTAPVRETGECRALRGMYQRESAPRFYAITTSFGALRVRSAVRS